MKRLNAEYTDEESLKLKRTTFTTRDGRCVMDKLTTNIDVMLYIYQMLELKDQLQLCLCSEQLKWIFETFVWKISYKHLKIIGFAHNYVVENESSSQRVCLPYEEYQLFLQVFAEDVRTLTLCYDALPDIRLFRNVTKLTYNFGKSLTREHLRLIAENCGSLEQLQLVYCGARYLNFVDLHEVLDVQLLQQFPYLQGLMLSDPYPDKISYHKFLDIITRTKLTELHLCTYIVPDEALQSVGHNFVSLKKANLWLPLDPNRWPLNYESMMGNMRGLTDLVLQVDGVVTDYILQALTTTCHHLESLQFTSTYFQDIRDFALPPQLMSLRFLKCFGLSHENLRQLLTQHSLRKFRSEATQYKIGEFCDLSISPLIESLNVDAISNRLFPSACRNNCSLKELTWYDNDIHPPTIEPLLLIEIGSCINLESLTIISGFMPLAPLMHLKALREFSLPHSMPFLNWTYIVVLLKHPTLEKITIGDGCPPAWVTRTIHIPSRGFRTNIKLLTISLRVFLTALRFWLELFNCNRDLILTCNNFEMNEKIIRHIIRHERFPHDLKTVELTGFSISVKDLKTNFDKTMGKFMYDTNYMKIMPNKFHRITLSRNDHAIGE